MSEKLKLGTEMREIPLKGSRPQNACDEPIVLTEREQLAMQVLFEKYEQHVKCSADFDEDFTEQDYDALRAKFF